MSRVTVLTGGLRPAGPPSAVARGWRKREQNSSLNSSPGAAPNGWAARSWVSLPCTRHHPCILLGRMTCPRCQSSYVVRSRVRLWEEPFLLLTDRRPYRCMSCRWRGWKHEPGRSKGTLTQMLRRIWRGLSHAVSGGAVVKQRSSRSVDKRLLTSRALS